MDGIMTTEFNITVKNKEITIKNAKDKNYNTIVETFYLS